MVKVKICGLTNAEDGFAAINAGADYLGFVVEIFGAERLVDRQEARGLFEQLRGTIPLVALTDLTRAEDIAELCGFVEADVVQLVKILPFEEVEELKRLLPELKVFKTIHVREERALEEAKQFAQKADFLVLDAATGKALGGTGKRADWKLCRKIVGESSKPVFLAGGLAPENVARAIKQVKPFGVDVSSGIKMQNNKRKIDLNKLKKFIERAKK